jgi:hypothetical protein
MQLKLRPIAVSFALLASACATSQLSLSGTAAPANELLPGPKPAPYVAKDSALVGEYDTSSGVQFIIEDGGKLFLLDTARASMKRTPLPASGIAGLAIKRRSVGPESVAGAPRAPGCRSARRSVDCVAAG